MRAELNLHRCKKKEKYLLYVVKEKKEKEAHWLTFLFFIKLNVKVK
jgi:hypothetical protein